MEKMPSKFFFLSVTAILLSLPDVALAQGAAKFSGADTAWVLTATALVLFMTTTSVGLVLCRARSVAECALGIDALFCDLLRRVSRLASSWL